MNTPHILVVDDEPDIRSLVKEILEDEGYEVDAAENAEMARKSRRNRRPDLILLDVWMPDTDGISLLKEWNEGGSQPCPVIMISGHGTVETAVEATRLGAYEFIEKPISLAKLLLTVERAIEAFKLQQENIGLQKQTHRIAEPAGKSMVMQNLRDQINKIALHDTWILLTGESGSGKQTVARYLHACSNRKDSAFIEIGAGSISKENSAIDLFGSEDNNEIKYGRLDQANGGTLFLGEVADIDLDTQARLLSTFESGEFIRHGGTEAVNINVRVIAATAKDLAKQVQQGLFREDLFYHLNVVPVNIPSLREHPEDVPELLQYYVDFFMDHENLAYKKFSVAAQNRLRNHGWRGNIRELKNLVQRLMILGVAEEISLEEVNQALGSEVNEMAGAKQQVAFNMPLREAREEFERAYLAYHLQESEGSVGKLAKLVGMERTHLYRKLRSLGIDPKNPVVE